MKNLLFFLFFICVVYGFSQNHHELDSLKNTISQQSHDTLKIKVLIEIADCYSRNNYDSSLLYFRIAVDLNEAVMNSNSLNEADRLKVLHKKSSILRKIGVQYRRKGEYEVAIDYANQALEIAQKINADKLIAKTYNNIGVVYYMRGDYQKAIESYQKALKINETNGDKLGQLRLYGNIGVIHYREKNNDLALGYFQKSLKISLELNDKNFISNNYSNIANIYRRKNDLDSALYFYNESLKIDKELGYKKGISSIYNNIGLLYQDNGEFEKALEYYRLTLKLKQELGDVYGLSRTKSNVAFLHLILADSARNSSQFHSKRAHLNKAISFANEAYDIAYKIGSLTLQKHAAEKLQKAYTRIGNYKEANRFGELLDVAKDTLYSKNKAEALAEMEAKYQSEKKQLEIDNLNKENALKIAELAQSEEKAKKQTILRNAFIIGFILMVTLVIVVVRSLLHKRKAYRLLIEQKKEIADQRDEIKAQTEELKSMNEELSSVNDKLIELDKHKEGMTAMIVHDLKNPLNTILGLSTDDKITQAGNQMLTMVTNILDIQKLETASFQLKQEPVELYSILSDVIERTRLLYERKSISINNLIKSNYIVAIDAQLVSRVFVNIISNAVKYTPNNGQISFEAVSELDGLLKIKVSDTGEGIPSDIRHKIFDKFSQFDARESGKTASTGLGLAFCKLVVEAHGGEIDVDSKVGEGSTFWFTLPLIKIEDCDKPETDCEDVVTTLVFKMSDLSDNDVTYLKKITEKLKKHSVFEFSDIIKTLDSVEIKSENIRTWKKNIENAVRACNENKYSELLDI
jgi:signal transduction histidine kinase/tetratricopeptide (TPR) repeat protein